ncbi:MAG: selenocysteine-specific translation elongation factor, partial [Gemmatimonadota bacterium]|nr:selenocysteine-specific translation elongation factor [Gemmatimonadota bacterium]
MIVGTAGHIDHGKTTLVRALTGVDTDRLPEEKRRGITIELGFAPLQLDGVGTVGVVDVPGHEAFVRTMLAGAAGIDVGLLVVAADDGVQPQTREHLAILRLLGVRGGVVALTKCDLADEEWIALVEEDVGALLRDTPFRDAPIVRVAPGNGPALDAVRDALARALRAVAARDPGDVFRLPVDRVFSVHGTGTVVTGTTWSGSLARDAQVRVLPSGTGARVRGIQNHGAPAERALPGQRTAVALAGVEVADVRRGDVLVTDPAWEPTLALRADATLLADAPRALGPRTAVRLHLGTAEVGARIAAAGGPFGPGQTRAVRIVLDAPLVARGGDRFVLRFASPLATIGGGVVTDALAPRRARPFDAVDAPVAARLARLL